MFIAHTKPDSSINQSVKEHLSSVSIKASENGEKLHIPNLSKLCGLFHDTGKYATKFQNYIRISSTNPNDHSLKGKVNHSTAGAKYFYMKYADSKNPLIRLTSQLIGMTISSHHGGLMDIVSLTLEQEYIKKLERLEEADYQEAINIFFEEIMSEAMVERVFSKAVDEVKMVVSSINSYSKNKVSCNFDLGMVQKFIYSTLIDADRLDTYEFISGDKVEDINREELWKVLSDRIEVALESFPKSSKIDLLRKSISDECKEFAKNDTGIYQLFVPTGGGKTLSSLRFALEHCKLRKKDRILYVIPFTTIIDQNAKEIRDILKYDEMILEHHSNIMMNDENTHKKYKLLTERWDNPIVLTTMVQLLNTIFGSKTQDMRRLHNLANSVIIFDEIQSIPLKCISIFNSAINFLSAHCNATVILCSATQPLLSETNVPIRLSTNHQIISNINEKFLEFKRTEIIDCCRYGGYSSDEIATLIIEGMSEAKSQLVIVNTKKDAIAIYQLLVAINEIREEEDQFKLFHLSTNMCPSHRLIHIQKLRNSLLTDKVICISTQLIEAGVNISFEKVIRALAGLDSIAQAAGRCNRHGERDNGNVCIINIADESISKLIDIKEGQNATLRVLNEYKENAIEFNHDLLSPEAMNRYYFYYYHERRIIMDYPVYNDKQNYTLLDLLSEQEKVRGDYQSKYSVKLDQLPKQAFKTAAKMFNAIDQNTRSILVPYGEGEKLILDLNGRYDQKEAKRLIRKAQHYCVNVYENDFDKLDRENALDRLYEGSIIALKKEFYDLAIGISIQSKPMEFYES